MKPVMIEDSGLLPLMKAVPMPVGGPGRKKSCMPGSTLLRPTSLSIPLAFSYWLYHSCFFIGSDLGRQITLSQKNNVTEKQRRP